ncbi:RDD family protein [Methanocalculus sp.]|uniref:RDD family protein n=1 Tax=Methanocalculus sp. TaxID=2004547 RepID=UPI00271C02DC|nr:RDD family protein [Methanocalculus sp.]MDO8842190.1 RDD family protein [Methanocalculus sp.]
MVELRIAGWESRLGAWIIDIIIVSVCVGVIERALLSLLGLNADAIFFGLPGPFLIPIPFWSNGVVLFLYWTLMEGITGQSIGKMVLNLRLTDRKGDPAGIPKAAVSAFGKAFLLPLDCLIGWLAMPGTGLRLTNRLSETIVIRTDYREPEGVRYIHVDE